MRHAVERELYRTKCEGAWLASEGRPLCALVTRVRAASEDDPWHACDRLLFEVTLFPPPLRVPAC